MMLIYLILVFCIIVLIFNCIIYTIEHKCPTTSFQISHLRGAKYIPFGISQTQQYKISASIFTTIVHLDRVLPCGVYSALTLHGNVLLFINKNNKDIGFIYGQTHSSRTVLQTVNWLDMWNVTKINSNDEFVRTFNSGCC